MSPDQAAKELLEALGDGQHILKATSPHLLAHRQGRMDLQEIFTSLVLLTEKLRQGVEDTELRGWYPILDEGPGSGFTLRWDDGFFKFFLTSQGVRYTYKNEEALHTIPHMVGESLAAAATRLVFNALRNLYTPGPGTGYFHALQALHTVDPGVE